MSKCSPDYKSDVCNRCGIKCEGYFDWIYEEYKKLILELRELSVCMDGSGQLGPRNAVMAIVDKYRLKR